MGFNIMDLMNGATRAAVEGVDNYEAITLNLDEIKVTKHNRYSMDDLEELATSILMDGAVNHWPGKRGVSSFRWT